MHFQSSTLKDSKLREKHLHLLHPVSVVPELCHDAIITDKVAGSDNNEIVLVFLRQCLDLGHPFGISLGK